MTLAKDISTGREGGEVDDPLLGGSVVSLQICRGHHVAEQAKIQAAAAVASAALIDEDAPGFDGRSGRSSAMDHASSFAWHLFFRHRGSRRVPAGLSAYCASEHNMIISFGCVNNPGKHRATQSTRSSTPSVITSLIKY
jgi:hypothetical protein